MWKIIFPPREWWVGGSVVHNHPISHFGGGILFGLAFWVVFSSVGLPTGWAGIALWSAFFGAIREEWQIELWGYNTFLKYIRDSVWDVVFITLGASFTVLIRYIL